MVRTIQLMCEHSTSVSTQFTLDKIPSKIVVFTTGLLLLVNPCRKATNSAGPSARQSTTGSAQHVAVYMSPNHWLLKPCMLAVHICLPTSSLCQLKAYIYMLAEEIES